MTGQHRATPEQWAHVEEYSTHSSSSLSPCVLELRDRLTALERMYETQRLATLEWGKDADKLKRWIDLHLHRIEALEAAANRQAILDSSPAPAGGLLERVANGISQVNAGPGVSPDVREVQARAAIRAVAEHMENRRPFIRLEGWDQAIRWLREEVERHG